MTKNTDESRFTLRIPTDLYARLVRFAKKNFRSVNSEIERILREALDKEKLS